MRIASVGVVATVMFLGASAWAQEQQPLPPLPPQSPQQPPPQGYPPPPPQGYPPPQYQQAPPGYQQPPQYQPQPYYQQAPPPPPPVEYQPPPEPTHAPKFSLWVGGRLGFLGFGGSFYGNEQQKSETTGNYIKNGLSLGIDVGARLGKRYLPYLFLEHGFMGQGHRFEGSSATSSSDLIGIGFRYTAGDVDSAGFLTDLSIGKRMITIKNGSDTYQMSSLEFFRLGLGAEVRISTLFVLSPMATLSGGVMSDTDGVVQFSQAGSGDGLKQPTYVKGAQIEQQTTYVVLGIHCGAHFDVFGK